MFCARHAISPKNCEHRSFERVHLQPIGDRHSPSELDHRQGSDEENDGLVRNARGPQKLCDFLAEAESSLGVSGCIGPGREEEEGEEEEEQ